MSADIALGLRPSLLSALRSSLDYSISSLDKTYLTPAVSSTDQGGGKRRGSDMADDIPAIVFFITLIAAASSFPPHVAELFRTREQSPFPTGAFLSGCRLVA
jgi:hypothetical protein